MAFRGWQAEAIEFFEGLEADNSKSFWQAHNGEYERFVRAPMDQLLAELEPEFGPCKVFRPYRDVRFSKDKSPYKTNIAATVGAAGYVSLSASGLGSGSGMYQMAADQLERYRRAVDATASGEQLAAITAEIARLGYECAPHDSLKTAPRGYAKDHPRIELLRGKGIILWRTWPAAAWLGTSKAKDRVVGALRAAVPLNAWLAEHVGETELVDLGTDRPLSG
ncbi:MAG TPA: DUF2461 domain-containing protein [Acidimicrobiales bacterium]|nr:DUF2461 domain-containing protein [Acidimicrobiales bacterium]